MATYTSLSDQDKAVVQNTIQLIRSISGSAGKVMNTLKAIADDTNAIALLSSVDNTDTIPNQSGLAGSDDMTKAELLSIWTVFSSMRTSFDTVNNRAAWSKAAGINNLLGNL